MALRRALASLLLFGISLALSAGCGDDDATSACDEEGDYRCTGQTLERCTAQSDGSLAFVALETCGDGSTCMASMRHCHPDGGGHDTGGHSAGGGSAGGHDAGGHSARGSSAGARGGA